MPDPSRSASLTGVVFGMAEREANGHLLRPPRGGRLTRPRPVALVQVTNCPWCGADRASALRRGNQNLRHAPLIDGPLLPEADQVGLIMLGCESLTARGMLRLVTQAADGDHAGRAYHSRAAAWAILTGVGHDMTPAEGDVSDLLRHLADTESWAPDSATTLRTLPASSRLIPDLPMSADSVALLRRATKPHFLTPHLASGLLAELDAAYRTHFWRIVLAGL